MARGESSRRLLVTAASLLLLAAALEAALRLDNRREVDALLAGRDPRELVTEAADGGLLYRLKPGLPGITNRHGFRDLERQRQKSPGVYRIAVIGDSVAMQMSIPFEDLWVRRLEDRLAAARPELGIQLLNFGVTGYGTGQQVELLERQVLDFDPDALLWEFHHNDAADPVLDGANGGLGIYYGRPRSYLARFLERRWTHLARRRSLRRQRLETLPGDLQRQLFWWDRVSGRLERLQRLARQRDLPVFFFILPSWPRDDDWGSLDGAASEFHGRLVDRAGALGFETLDLLPPLRAEDPALLREAPDDPWHPNRAGHAWLAEALADWLAPRLPARTTPAA